jgi:hypothetical protein
MFLSGMISTNLPGVVHMKFNLLLSCTAALVSLTACSQNGSVSLKGVDLSTSAVGSETYVNMEAIISMGSLKFPEMEIPVLNPKDRTVLGSMALSSLADGTNRLSVSIDYSAATQLDPTLGTSLPNGRELPLLLGVPAGTSIVGIPILTNSRIYIGGNSNSTLYVGAAIAISAFDSALSSVSLPLNIFFGYPFSTQTQGYAGLFTGPTAGTNGIGVFVKQTKVAATPTAKAQFRTLASVETAGKFETASPTGGEEITELSNISLFKLDRLMKKHRTLKIK